MRDADNAIQSVMALLSFFWRSRTSVVCNRSGRVGTDQVHRAGRPPEVSARDPIEMGDHVAWFDGVEWWPGTQATSALLPGGHDRPAHARGSEVPALFDGGGRAALDALIPRSAKPPEN